MKHVLAIGAATLVAALTVGAVLAEEFSVRQQGVVPYLSGGVGADEREAMTKKIGDFNLHLIFSVNDGKYIADTKLRVVDQFGNKILEVISDGPWLFAAVPPGEYTVQATYREQEKRRSVRVGSRGQERIHFHF